MKDKELRKQHEELLESHKKLCRLLEEYGVINTHGDGRPMDVEPANSNNRLYDERAGYRAHYAAQLDNLEAKFNAINKHYGITVEHEDAKYTVKEIK